MEPNALGLIHLWRPSRSLVASVICLLGFEVACGSAPLEAYGPQVPSAVAQSTGAIVCTDVAAKLLAASTPSDQLRLAECFERNGRLGDALRLVAKLEQDYFDDADLMRAVSERAQSLIQQRVPVSGLPARLELQESPIPLPMVRGRIAESEGLFVWDSGAETTGIDQTLCSKLGLKTFGNTRIDNATGATRSGTRVGILDQTLVLGSVEVRVASVLCLDLSDARAVDPKLLGIIGGNVLRSSPYQLNLKGRWIDFGGAIPSNLIRLKSTFTASSPYVWADLDGHSVRFLLDTGSVDSTVSEATVADLGVTATSLGTVSSRVVAGGRMERDLKVISVSRFSSGQERRRDVQLTVEALNLLGGDFLGDRTLIVDHDSDLIAFTSDF